MAHTIDHRILIPAAPDVIWDTISDISRNPRWQVDCREVAFLTSLRQGQGVRWRYVNERGRSFVVEITAWYNKLGYEYRIVDGAPFKFNQGRLRLQEIAEGTIVQWTFNYEPQGMFGSRIIGSRRNVENAMIDSLWTLWKQITAQEGIEEHHAKSLMRDAPDVEQRAAYISRHGAGFSPVEQAETIPSVNDKTPVPVIQEPPVADDDTRPRPVVNIGIADSPVSTVSTEEQPVNVTEPDFLRDLHEESVDTPTHPTGFPPVSSSGDRAAVQKAWAEPHKTPAETSTTAAEDETDTAPAEPTAASSPLIQPGVQTGLSPWELERLPESAEDDLDTSKVSVFDLFGVPKPSETQESQAVSISEAPADDDSAGFAVTGTPEPEVESIEKSAEPTAATSVGSEAHPPVTLTSGSPPDVCPGQVYASDFGGN
ncbi:hypothetical protein HC928_23065 [bacterium]|nr:hypothetical protein [bacterium]